MHHRGAGSRRRGDLAAAPDPTPDLGGHGGSRVAPDPDQRRRAGGQRAGGGRATGWRHTVPRWSAGGCGCTAVPVPAWGRPRARGRSRLKPAVVPPGALRATTSNL
ncbi:MAG: hypothetical protein AVDCRST_MAG49-1582 [uncultured Thermomicrobiales bacterium]|uniref:Uncharacterized protein n=1 Tax=uncultured Thermomicrobiales bacterium TaxID=1645740 RepID=A0A6J4UH67_9BACT|nr:MAG: hypothetical protein AVDCRST_MAG49-1582 [uncultured Thermomicrobiales bacterium]